MGDIVVILGFTSGVMYCCSQVNDELGSHAVQLEILALEYDQLAAVDEYCPQEQQGTINDQRQQKEDNNELRQDLRRAARRARDLAMKIRNHDVRVHFVGLE